MTLAICVATMRQKPTGYPDLCQPGIPPGDITLATANSVTNPPVYVRYNNSGNNAGVVGSYQMLYEATTEEILCFMHDDCIVRERGWDERVLAEFQDPAVGVVGFGGALWHGTPDLYKVPYVLTNLRRGSYRSNVDDAETHGERFTGSCDVAVLDGFCLIVRRSLLDRIGGFTGFVTGFFGYDYELAALARRHGYRIRCVGIRCQHRGGSSSTQMEGSPLTSQEEYNRAHRAFYDTYMDVMPCHV